MLRAYGEENIFGEAYGVGPVRVVWLHGWRRTGADFSRAAGNLANVGISSVALDLPGFGASPLPLHAGGADMYASLLRGALDAMSTEPLVLVGHSFGGRVATVFAAEYPERVHGLLLTGVPLVHLSSSRRSPWGYRVVRELHRRGVIGESRMEAARQKYGSSDYRNSTGLLRDILVTLVNESYEMALGRITSPITLLWGENDAEVPLSVARRAIQVLTSSTSATLDVVADTGHLLPTERPMELAAHVLRIVGES